VEKLEKKERARLDEERQCLEKPVQITCFAEISLVRIFLYLDLLDWHNRLQKYPEAGEIWLN
jgi:hypothetical protein